MGSGGPPLFSVLEANIGVRLRFVRRLWIGVSAATKKNMEDLTLLNNEDELERYLTYGKWGLSDDDIIRLNKDEEMEQRVSIFFIHKKFFKEIY